MNRGPRENLELMNESVGIFTLHPLYTPFLNPGYRSF